MRSKTASTLTWHRFIKQRHANKKCSDSLMDNNSFVNKYIFIKRVSTIIIKDCPLHTHTKWRDIYTHTSHCTCITHYCTGNPRCQTLMARISLRDSWEPRALWVVVLFPASDFAKDLCSYLATRSQRVLAVHKPRWLLYTPNNVLTIRQDPPTPTKKPHTHTYTTS